jgi:hypothetical protein
VVVMVEMARMNMLPANVAGMDLAAAHSTVVKPTAVCIGAMRASKGQNCS